MVIRSWFVEDLRRNAGWWAMLATVLLLALAAAGCAEARAGDGYIHAALMIDLPDEYGCDRDRFVREQWVERFVGSVNGVPFRDIRIIGDVEGCEGTYTVETFPRESVECAPGRYLVLWHEDERCQPCS